MAETRESLLTKSNDELKELIKSRNLPNRSKAKNKESMVDLILNPGVFGPAKSPGRPAGAGVKATKAKGTKKGAPAVTKVRAVDYSQTGLIGLTKAHLKDLATHQQVSGVSNKKKEEIVAALLAKPLATAIVLRHTTPGGSSDTVTVNPGAGAARAPSPARSVIQVPVQIPIQVPTPAARVSPRQTGMAIPVTTMGQYVPAPAFRQ